MMYVTNLIRTNYLKTNFIFKNQIVVKTLLSSQSSAIRSFSTSNVSCKTKTKRQKIFVYDVTKRPTAELDESVARLLKAGTPVGRSRLPLICPPEKIVNSLNHLLQNSKRSVYDHLPEYLEAAKKLRNVLVKRHPPLKEKFGQRVSSAIEQKVRKQYESKMEAADADGILYKQLELETEIQKKILSEIKRCESFWKQIQYDDESAVWAYTLGKSVYDYACMYTVMKEIKRRVPPHIFQPRTLLDFGSGVGTSIWAALEVFGAMNEVFAIDTSPKMNDFARLLLQGGNEQARLPAGYFFRLHLPKESTITYDLVTCSFTLLDLHSESERLTVIDNLWKKTNQFLILIEVGTNAGFQVMSEARHYLTEVCHAAEVEENVDDIYTGEAPAKSDLIGHIFAPCPHEVKCPRYHLDNIPCNFDVRYRSLYFDKMPNSAKEDMKIEKFCYLVFRKGNRASDCDWPRLTSEPLERHNHVVCRMCTASGKLQEYVAINSKEEKNKQFIFRYAKRLHCGDQIKVRLTDHPDDVENTAAESSEEVRSLDCVNLEGDENQNSVVSDEKSSDSMIFSNDESSDQEFKREAKVNVRDNHDSKVTSCDEVKI